MRISIATGCLRVSRDKEGTRDTNEILQALHDAGYDTVDIGFDGIADPNHILRGDDWEQKIDQLGETAAKLGIAFGQSHLPFPKWASFDLDPKRKIPGYAELFDLCLERSYYASSRLGVPYGTVHPLTFVDTMADTKRTLEKNHQYYDRYVELGTRCNMGTAFENMRPDSPEWRFTARYCQSHVDLMELVDSYQGALVGICWDTGHANQSMCDQPTALRDIGSRLKTLHMNDNHYGTRDQHLLPFMGTVDWYGILSALVDIDYQGTLNYEVGKVTHTAPWELQLDMLETMYTNGCQIRQIYEEIKAARAAEQKEEL